MSQVTADKASQASTQSFLTALVTNTALLVVEVGAFAILQQHFKRVYSPRTFLPPPDKRSNTLPPGPWRWLFTLLRTPSREIIHKNGLDAYMFLRFLRLLAITFGVYLIVTWLVLLPVDSAGIGQSKSNGISQFNWQNITPDQSNRYAAHIIVVYVLTLFTLWLIRRESLKYITLRQQFLVSPSHSRLAQARTVLITGVPDELCEEKALRRWASFVPGGINRVWIYKDSKELNNDYKRRLKACDQLEKACSKVLRVATKTWGSRQLAAKKAHKKASKASKHSRSNLPDLEKSASDGFVFEKPMPTKEALLDLVPLVKWPTHRLGNIPFIGRKVNTFEFCKEEIRKLNANIPPLQQKYGTGKPLGSVFIECNLQIGAHVLAQVVAYHEPLMMLDRAIDVHPKDIIWNNLDDGTYETRSRYVISWLLTFALILFWFAPVAFVGLVSNLSGLCQRVSWLAWVCKTPTPVPGIIQGLLPPVFLAILFILLPIALRALAIYECVPRYTQVDISVYKRYFFFLIVHGFLIVTLSSGLTAVIPQIISNPAQTVSQLASQLPLSAVFFLTYVVTQGFAGAGSALLQLAPLVLHFIKKRFLGRTPRQAFQVSFVMPSTRFGLLLPQMSLLATIGIAYSILSPLINGLALVVFALYFYAWKFLFMYVFDQPDEKETGGLFFPLAISNLFTGIYIEQICLAALFFLKAAGPGGHLTFLAQGILMLVLILITLAAHVLVNKAVMPVTTFLPMSLATKKLQERYLRKKQNHGGRTDSKDHSEDEDMFNRNRVKSILKHRLKRIENRLEKEEAKIEDIGSKEDPTALASGASTGIFKANDGAIQGLERTPTIKSTSSDSSKKSGSKAAKDGTPELAPPAERLHRESEDADADSDSDQELAEHAFDHPSTYGEARWIWLPCDELGFSKVLINELKGTGESTAGIDASDVGATMDEEGVVDCQRNPPDENWVGGYDQ